MQGCSFFQEDIRCLTLPSVVVRRLSELAQSVDTTSGHRGRTKSAAASYGCSKVAFWYMYGIRNLHEGEYRRAGCLAESPLFREKREWFRRFFPIFMKYITGGFVSEDEAGQRLFQVTAAAGGALVRSCMARESPRGNPN